MINLTNAAGSNDIAINGTEVIYTASFPTKRAKDIGIWLKATSAVGTPGLKIQLEQGRALPTTEGAADSDWTVGDGVPDIYSSLKDESAHIKSVDLVPMPYARLKITGLSSNPADTILDAEVFIQETSGI